MLYFHVNIILSVYTDLGEPDYDFTNDTVYDPYLLEPTVPASGIYNSHVSIKFKFNLLF